MQNKPNPKHSQLIQNAPNQVIRLEGVENYTRFIFDDGSTKLMSYTLKKYDTKLNFPFVRVNKSCIVNFNFCLSLCQINKRIQLIDGSEIQISRRRFEEVLKNVVLI
jgi:two-component system LytT family response regulator